MVLILDEGDVTKLADVGMIIADVEKALRDYSDKKAIMPSRYQMDVPGTTGTIRVMPVALPQMRASGLKVLTGTAGKRSANGTYFAIMLFDLDGSLLCLMSANRLTQLRTGAASAIATKYLARKDSETVGIIGAGVQGAGQIEAISHIISIRRGLVYDLSQDQAERMIRFTKERLGLEFELTSSADKLAGRVDVLVTATTSTSPLFAGSVIRPGTHVNAIGSNMPTRRELDLELLKRAKVVVDSVDQATKESGDLIEAVSHGYDVSQIHAELGEIIAGRKEGREGDQEITLFKSVGIAVEDLAAAQRIYGLAVKQGIGTDLKLENA